MAARLQVLGYTRVSTEEQGRSGLGLSAQRVALEAEAQRKDWALGILTEVPISAKSLKVRRVLAAPPELLKNHDADALAVSKLDRLSRNVHGTAELLEDAHRQRWSLTALDVAIDTSTIAGAASAQVMVVFAEMERKRIGERTREALARKCAEGVSLGRPSTIIERVVQTIVQCHQDGMGLTAIADMLNARGTPTASGGERWYPSTVQAVLRGQRAAKYNTEQRRKRAASKPNES